MVRGSIDGASFGMVGGPSSQPTWSSTSVVPGQQKKRLGPANLQLGLNTTCVAGVEVYVCKGANRH